MRKEVAYNIAWQYHGLHPHVDDMLEGSPATKDKAMRWLGFIQGVLWAGNIRTLEQLKEDSRTGVVNK